MSLKESLSNASVEDFIGDLRNFATITGILGGICYFIGYLTMNFYLSRFGSHYASLVQARYFTTGFLYIIISSLTAAGPLAAWILIRLGRYEKFKAFLLFLSGAMMSIVTIWGLGYFLVSFPYIEFGRPYYPAESRRLFFMISFSGSQILLWLPALLTFAINKMESRLYFQREKSKGHDVPGGISTLRTALTSFVVVLFLILSVYSYAIRAYPQIPTSFGGGAPKEVRLLLSDPSAMNGLSIAVQGQLTEPVILLDQTDRILLIMDKQSLSTFELSSALVSAIIHQK